MKHAAILASPEPLSIDALAMLPIDDPVVQDRLIDLIATTLDAIDAGRAWPALATLAALPPSLAELAYELLLLARFPDGSGSTADLDDASLLSLVVLTGVASERAVAMSLLNDELTRRTTPFFYAGACAARAVLAGYASLASVWPAATLADPARIATHPLDVAAHRAHVRALADRGDLRAALDALTTALSLPLGAGEKTPLGTELAVLLPIALSHGMAEAVGAWRVKLALGANTPVVVYATRLLDELPQIAAVALPEAMVAAREFLSTYAAPTRDLISPYPIIDGKPHINMLFLEVTNYCNQKCTFCPDMHREVARSWLPLEQVKALIDQIADTLHLNMLALNAYGEPLLHPDIDQIIAYVREKNMSWPTFMTTHGLTLVDKKLKQLSNNYPTGIAVSMHNDNQASYAATRSAKIGDYETLVTRVSNLARQMVNERAPCHMRLYQMVNNGHEDLKVPPEIRAAFPSNGDRVALHVRKWEAIAAEIVAQAPPEAQAIAFVTDRDFIEHAFRDAFDDHGIPMPLIEWTDVNGARQRLFMSCRPLETYANLLLEQHDDWTVEHKLLNPEPCRFLPDPSLTIFATGKLGVCCLDLNNTANFGSLSDYPSLVDALHSPEARQMFAELSNGIAVSKGCQICLGEGTARCGSKSAEMAPV
ncbi:radical SAM/SPASM domain-containing protein [Sphingomonas floccifaciens]|uniref:Radical SAM/SPASM domain-containing protein n=1 Tax=Sphingomonas floccifaciens TaxID=1844115 RepID=A0ABW4NBT5_9SPHN